MLRTAPRASSLPRCVAGEPISAAEALQYDLVNHVVPAAEFDARSTGCWPVDKSPTAIRRGKYAPRAMQDMTFEQALGCAEAQIGSISRTEDRADRAQRMSPAGLDQALTRRAPPLHPPRDRAGFPLSKVDAASFQSIVAYRLSIKKIDDECPVSP
ncbi:hypothetical protein [Chelatococcus reniformis]|uniref:Uncharacterized protein n=1 Tax=Chelatococcus reniformis TaxID=1494448 RepID=A0A916UR75_9HYPH|nr:hypothetical protein [Chelatococcus reniformis]GGC83295.1 hypothetical protein GCM10010994_46470 [Chelatococcus reniformis]